MGVSEDGGGKQDLNFREFRSVLIHFSIFITYFGEWGGKLQFSMLK